MRVVNALLFIPRVLGVLVGTALWIVAVPLIEFGRGVIQAIGKRPDEKPANTKAERRVSFDPTRVRPIWTTGRSDRAPAVAKPEPPESDEERRAS
ncbi:MAG: hypothetical protein ACR2OD_06855 [Gaiellaceae bacterium]